MKTNPRPPSSTELLNRVAALELAVNAKDAEFTDATIRLENVKADLKAKNAKISELTSLLAKERELNAAGKAPFQDLQNAHDLLSRNYHNLKRAHGLAPADTVPEIRLGGDVTPASILAQFNRISDPAESARFWKEHASAIQEAQIRTQPLV